MSDVALMPSSAPRGSASWPVRLLAIRPEEARLDVRGFSAPDDVRREALEAVGLAFIAGYNRALVTSDPGELMAALALVSADLRGFAAEGAAMGAAVADALPLPRPALEAVLERLEPDFTYLAHVGAGWALARLPWRRRRILKPLDPVHRWLAFDGLGFHDTYFRHRKVLSGWRRERRGYAARAYEQGVGRALWFVAGGSVAEAAGLVAAAPAGGHGDLWAGLGLALAYAGPGGGSEAARGLDLAKAHAPAFRQGVAFACEARARGGHVPSHTEAAARAIGSDTEALVALVREERRRLHPGDDGEPPYETWRRRVAGALAGEGGAA